MGVTKQKATRQINRFIPLFSFMITRSWEDTTDDWQVQAEAYRACQSDERRNL